MMKNPTNADAQPRDYTDLLAFLAFRPTVLTSSESGLLTLATGKKRKKISPLDLSRLAANGLIARNGKQLILSASGQELLTISMKRSGVAVVSKSIGLQSCIVAVNEDESPLGALARRKTSEGASFLAQNQFDAGERIREDFTRSMLMPRTSANWQAAVSGGRRAGEENGVENLTNSAIAARARFDAAVTALADDLSGVVVDICCFLKGFEQVERERGWPKRSAKFMLRAGLSVLARHYWPQNMAFKQRITHWGAEGYRTTVR